MTATAVSGTVPIHPVPPMTTELPEDTPDSTGVSRISATPSPVHVPGYGWVDWPAELLDAQARYLSFIHRPVRSGFGLRIRRKLGTAPIEVAVCVFCGREWICPEAAWAHNWLTPAARLWGRRAGRHRKRAEGRPRRTRIDR